MISLQTAVPGLVLRELGREDAEDYFALVDRNRDLLERWEPGMAFTSAEGVRQYLAPIGPDGQPVVTPLNMGMFVDGQFAGQVQYAGGFHGGQGSIGYWLGAEFQGRGVVTAAVRALLDWLFTEMDVRRVTIDCAEDNEASRGIPMRLGFTFLRLIPPEEWGRRPGYPGQFLFEMLPEQWRAAGGRKEAGSE